MKFMIPDSMPAKRLDTILNALPGSRNKDPLKTADDIVQRNAYAIPPFGVVKYNELVDWQDRRSRSFERLIHGHTFLGCLLAGYDHTSDEKYLNKARKLVADWIQKHNYETHSETMAYHDETTALRLQHWLKLFIYAGDKMEDSEKDILKSRMWSTAKLLSEDSFHSTNTNHGMFQDISLLLFSLYFEYESPEECLVYKELSIMRLDNYFRSVYTVEGVHKEHSPSYHMLVSSYIKRLIKWLREVEPEMCERFTSIFNQTEDFSKYIVYPNGYFPPLCDTEPKPLISGSYRSLYSSPEYKYSISGGKEGRAPKIADKVFQESGYAIFRNDWRLKEKGTYVLFSAAYHADYHKHSDDLNVLIYSDGEIISEAGPNGYNYQDPFTKYAYSSRAHNTLMVDKKGLPRTDGHYDKVRLTSYEINESASKARGLNERFSGVTHHREVTYNKSSQNVKVHDTVKSQSQHEYKFLWHLATDIEATVQNNVVELFRKNEKVCEIEFTSESSLTINKVHGQEKPEVQGWKFAKMEHKAPATCLEVTIQGDRIEYQTEFRLNDFKMDHSKSFEPVETPVDSPHETIKYYFEPAKKSELNDQLLVLFQDSQENNVEASYMNAFDLVNCNKIYFLGDFGKYNSSSNKMDYKTESYINSLLSYKMSKLNILNSNVTTVGLDGSGSQALSFGMKYFHGKVIAEITNLEDNYNINNATSVAPLINIITNENNDYVNSNLHQELKKNSYTVEVMTSTSTSNQDKLLDILESYKLAEFNNQKNIKPKINKVQIKGINGNQLKVSCDAEGENLQYAYYVYKDGEVINKQPYKKERSTFDYIVEGQGSFKVRVYVKSRGLKTAKNTKEIQLN